MRLIQFPRITDPRGELCVAEHLPFQIKRVYWINHVHKNAERGGHAHKALRRILIPMAGSFTAIVNDQDYFLSDAGSYAKGPAVGLLIEPMEWLVMREFSACASCCVLASAEYDEADYIRDRAELNSRIPA